MSEIRDFWTADEAESHGYVVDRCTYPWVAYKGPRFSPTEIFSIHTGPPLPKGELGDLLEMHLAPIRRALARAMERIETLQSGLRQIAVGEYDIADREILMSVMRQTAETYLEMDAEDAASAV